MPRLRDSQTGSIVNVSEETAKQLGPQFVPVESVGASESQETVPKPKRGRPRKTEE